MVSPGFTTIRGVRFKGQKDIREEITVPQSFTQGIGDRC
jgi:hypothetical protein